MAAMYAYILLPDNTDEIQVADAGFGCLIMKHDANEEARVWLDGRMALEFGKIDKGRIWQLRDRPPSIHQTPVGGKGGKRLFRAIRVILCSPRKSTWPRGV